MEGVLLILIKVIVRLVGTLPSRWQLAAVSSLLRIFVFFSPRLKRVALRNLEIAFPEKDLKWRNEILSRSVVSFARLIVDTIDVKKSTPAWLQAHVSWPGRAEYLELKQKHAKPGVLFASGHLGNFEVLARYPSTLGYPLAVVAREFKLKKVDEWWKGFREACGNRVISRRGAFKEVVQCLAAGQDVGVLIDQNVRNKHAVFVDWFGKPAATTRMFALAALKTKAPVFAASISYGGKGRYQIQTVRVKTEDVYFNAALNHQQKIEEITRRVSLQYEKMIRGCPEEWFWMHRRWRTRPPGDIEEVYAGC